MIASTTCLFTLLWLNKLIGRLITLLNQREKRFPASSEVSIPGKRELIILHYERLVFRHTSHDV